MSLNITMIHREIEGLIDKGSLALPENDLLEAWQAWRLGDHGPFYVLPIGNGEADIRIADDSQNQGIPGDELIDKDPANPEDINPSNLTSMYWWRDQIELLDTINVDTGDDETPIDIDWVLEDNWGILIGLPSPDEDEIQWLEYEETYESKKRAEHKAGNINNPTRLKRLD